MARSKVGHMVLLTLQAMAAAARMDVRARLAGAIPASDGG